MGTMAFNAPQLTATYLSTVIRSSSVRGFNIDKSEVLGHGDGAPATDPLTAPVDRES